MKYKSSTQEETPTDIVGPAVPTELTSSIRSGTKPTLTLVRDEEVNAKRTRLFTTVVRCEATIDIRSWVREYLDAILVAEGLGVSHALEFNHAS
jgi:hypothetical protein